MSELSAPGPALMPAAAAPPAPPAAAAMPVAGPTVRLLAGAMDLIYAAVFSTILALIPAIGLSQLSLADLDGQAPAVQQTIIAAETQRMEQAGVLAAVGVVLLLFNLLYWVLPVAGRMRGTIGKRSFGLAVLDARSRRPLGLGAALLRGLPLALPLALVMLSRVVGTNLAAAGFWALLALVVIDTGLSALRGDRRSLGDLLAGSNVFRTARPRPAATKG